MNRYSYADTRELAPDLDEVSHDVEPVDSFARDVDTFERDNMAELLNDLLIHDVDSRAVDVELTAQPTREQASATAHSVSAMGIRDVSSFAFGLLRDVADASRVHPTVRALDMSRRVECERCGAPRVRCICPRT